MAKSNPRFVDKLDRKQRLANKLARNFNDGINKINLARHDWMRVDDGDDVAVEISSPRTNKAY